MQSLGPLYLLLLTLLAWGPFHTLQADDSSPSISWYDGDHKRTFHRALDEIALYSPRPLPSHEWPQILSRILPGAQNAQLVEHNTRLTRFKLENTLDPTTWNRLPTFAPPDIVVAPVFYPSAQTTQSAYVLLPQMIIHFTSPTSEQQARNWGKDQGLTLLKSLSADNAYLFFCQGGQCIGKSRDLYLRDGRVRYAYPNWIRPRQTRQISFGNTEADLSIDKRAYPDTFIEGTPFEYRIIIRNLGPAPAYNVIMVDNLPTSLQLDEIVAAKGFCSGSTRIQCNIGQLPTGDSTTITLRVTPSSSGPLTNEANVSSFSKDPNPDNNSASVTIQVSSADGTGSTGWNDPLFPDQWYLENKGQGGGLPGADTNVAPAWSSGLSGKGVRIAIVDDGLEIGHEDLQANTRNEPHHDWVDDDDDPTAGEHGTSVAGIAAAQGNNDKGIVGAAPSAKLIGLRLLGASSDTNEAEALGYRPDIVDLSSNSWGPADTGQLLAGPSPITQSAIVKGVTQGRNGKGTIYCWAGGNGGDNDNSNYDGYANLRYTIAVAASTNQGTRAYYSEKGANILINTPSSGGTLAVTTTDRSGFAGYDFGNYTDQFGGTSAASPLACGLIALLLEANPDLGWRDVQFILATTAYQNDPQDSDWETNGAGYPVNHKYGFGRIDIAAAVAAAKNWTPLGDEVSVSGTAEPNAPIPDNDPAGISSTIDITDDIQIESVEVIFSADDHPFWGDLDIRLISPSGTVSRLAESHDSGKNTATYSNWRFTSMRHLGESSQGTWTLSVRDLASGNVGTFQSWQLHIHGTDNSGSPPPPQESADLALNLQDTPDPATVGESLLYTIDVSNLGPDPATGVMSHLSLPSQWSVSKISTTRGSCTQDTSITCNLGNLGVTEQVQIVIEVLPTSTGNFTIEATVEADQTDPNLSNNNATETTTVVENQTTYPLNVTVFGFGTVTSDPAGIDCPGDCREDYPQASRVTLHAHPGAGRRVLWMGNCSGRQLTCEVTMSAAKDVTAWFH